MLQRKKIRTLSCLHTNPGSVISACYRQALLKALPAFILLLSGAGHGKCQLPPSRSILPVTVYNVEQGLNQSTVNQVLQDHRGLIWVATGDGLQCFDGTDFRSFDPNPALPPPYGNIIREMTETTPGRMVLSTTSSLLSFNSRTGTFGIFPQEKSQYTLLFDTPVGGAPLCWTSGDGLCQVRDGAVIPVSLRMPPGEFIPAGFKPQRAVRNKNGGILMAGETGCLRLERKQKESDAVQPAGWFRFPKPCQYIAADKAGNVCILSGGIIYSLDDNGTLTPVFNTGLKESNYLFMDDRRNFWVADPGHRRLYRIAAGRMTDVVFVNYQGLHADTLKPVVRNITGDRSGNLWIGTDGNGLLFHSPDREIFRMSGIGFTRCMAYYQGEIWAGTFKNGLWRLTADLSAAVRVNPAVFGDEMSFFDLFADGSGRLWIAANSGIYVTGRNGDLLYHYPLNTSSASFLHLPDGRLLLSSYDRLYACKMEGQPGMSFIREQTQIQEVLSLSGANWVRNNYGLYRTDSAAGVLASMTFRESDRLVSGPVHAILPLDGNLWAGTEHGIACFSPEGAKQPVPACMAGLRHEVICALQTDAQCRIWFAGNRGVGCISRNRDRIIRFTLQNNLQSLEFNNNASLAVQAGWIYFGGIRGINGINTSGRVNRAAVPEAGLISLSISDTAWPGGVPPADATVTVDWHSAHISGSVFNPGYLPPGMVQYSFLLEGYQQEWSPPSPVATFSYRNLPPGHYRLWVRCTDGYREPGKAKCLLTADIPPPFWKTWWFRLLAAFFAFAMITLAVYRVQAARYRNRLLELQRRIAIDRERLRISQDMHDEIGASLTQISVLSEIVKTQRDTGEMMKLVDRISGISGRVVDDMGEIIWAMNPKNDNLAGFCSYLRQHASEYLSISPVSSRISFPEECPPVDMTSEQRRNLFLVVKEALHNVVKHSGAGHVSLGLSYAGGTLRMSVEDDGKGFDNQAAAGKGNGLANMRRRISGLGGVFSLASGPGKGTRIDITLFLGKP